ncbi:MAG: CBU_0592 family membrane protein [Syntrophomonadaceae bacterium]
MIGQAVSLAGAALILAAFAAQQAGRWHSTDRVYLAFNFFGSAILAYFAVRAGNLGLIALEGAWAVISLWSLGRALLARPR